MINIRTEKDIKLETAGFFALTVLAPIAFSLPIIYLEAEQNAENVNEALETTIADREIVETPEDLEKLESILKTSRAINRRLATFNESGIKFAVRDNETHAVEFDPIDKTVYLDSEASKDHIVHKLSDTFGFWGSLSSQEDIDIAVSDAQLQMKKTGERPPALKL